MPSATSRAGRQGAVRYVVMGVSGAGKSVVGARFADTIGVRFLEGDALHPAENLARMAAGTPLTDDYRIGWLTTLAAALAQAREANEGLVLSCSALKRSYRDRLRSGDAHLQLVFLYGSQELLAARMSQRVGHFMPLSLLESQLATLEPPAADERAWAYEISASPEVLVTSLVQRVASSRLDR